MVLKKAVGGIVGFSLIITSVALIGAAVAPYIDPINFDWTSFLGLMYPFLLVLHLLSFVFYIIVKRSKRSLLFLIPALATANIFVNSFGINVFGTSEVNKGNSLKFMSYNVHMFRASNNINEVVQAPILQLLQQEQPDILCMQDFQSQQEGGLSSIDSIRTILNSNYYYDGPDDPNTFPTKSIVTVSRYPIVNRGFVILSEISPGNQALYTDINRNGKILRVYNVHFESLGFQAHEYEEWRNADIIGKFEFLFKVKDKFSVAFANRSRQVKLLKSHAATSPYPFIIGGDFNDTPSSYAVGYTMKGIKNAFREKGRGYVVTFNGGLPDFQIDYIMVNPVFSVLDYKVIRQKLSDHYPVIAVLGY